MALRLYYDAMSQPSRALLLFTRAAAIPCQEVPVALRRGEHMGEDYAKINPFKKVPVIDHDGFVLTESVAILKYLCRNFKVPAHWYPTELKAQSRVDEFMAWQHLNLRIHGSMFFRTKYIIPLLTGKEPDEQQVAKYEKGLQETLELLETVWLKRNPYMAGPDLTIADLLAVTELEQPGIVGYDVRQNRPILKQYMDLVKSRLNPTYDEVHSVVYTAAGKYKDNMKKHSAKL